MKHGHYADNELPEAHNPKYDTNSLGYRCPEFTPLPDGGKNVVVLGCSHTFGEGLDDSEVWVSQLEKLTNNEKLRFWNLAQPGASADKCVRILYGTERILFPKIIIVCWPQHSRRERLDDPPVDLVGGNELLKYENENIDKNNFLKCVFQVEKFAEYNRSLVFHCFSDIVYDIPNTKYLVLNECSIKTSWPTWDKHYQRQIITQPDLARDGQHYGPKHHRAFAEKLHNKFAGKLR